MRLWLKTFLGMMAVILGASTLWIWAAPLTGPEGRNVTFTEPNTIDAPMMKGNLIHLHNQTVDPTPVAGDLILYTKSNGLFTRDPAGNVVGPYGVGGGGGGTGVGLTARLITTTNITRSGEQTIEGILTSGSRVFVAGQTTPTENGLYVTASGAWTRAPDAATGATFTAGTQVTISDGIAGPTGNKGTCWMYTSSGSYNTSALTAIKSCLGPTGEERASKNVNSGYMGLTTTGIAPFDRVAGYAVNVPSPMAAPNTITPTAIEMGIEGTAPATDLSSTPQIAAGTVAGQLLILVGTHATNTVKLDNGTGVRLCGNTGSILIGLNGPKPAFRWNTVLSVWEQLICGDLQEAFYTGNAILTGSTAATGLIWGNVATGNYCSNYWDAANGNVPTTQCFCGGGSCDHVVQLAAGKNFLIKKSDGSTLFSVDGTTGTVTGLSVPRQMLLATLYPGVTGHNCGTTNYWSVVGTNAAATTETDAAMVMTHSATVRNLRYQAPAPIPSGETHTITVRKNSASTALSCAVIQGGSTGSGEINDSACANTATTVAVVAGDVLTTQVACSGSSNPNIAAAITMELE